METSCPQTPWRNRFCTLLSSYVCNEFSFQLLLLFIYTMHSFCSILRIFAFTWQLIIVSSLGENQRVFPPQGCAGQYRLTLPSPLKCTVLTSLLCCCAVQDALWRELKSQNIFLILEAWFECKYCLKSPVSKSAYPSCGRHDDESDFFLKTLGEVLA